MMLLGCFLLICVLKTQRILVESFPLSLTSRLSGSRRKSWNGIVFSQGNNNDASAETNNKDSSRPLNDIGIVDFDWKAIANHVFDESIDLNETPYTPKPQNDGDDEKTPHLHSKPIILFDGVCNLCNGGVNFAIDHDRNGSFRFASLQSNVAKSLLIREGKDPFTTSDIVLVTAEKSYYSSEAVAKIMTKLDLPVLKFLGLVGQVTPSFARNVVYKVVSGNRFILGENDSCRMDFDGEYTWRFVSDPPESISFPDKRAEEPADE